MSYKCEHCGMTAETEESLDVEHRGCRLKAVFPGAYSERGDGLITFDPSRMAESLGLFRDIIVARDGQPLHPLEGDVHFRIGVRGPEPEVWVGLPVQVGNNLSSFSYRITARDWVALVANVNLAIEAAWRHIEGRVGKKG